MDLFPIPVPATAHQKQRDHDHNHHDGCGLNPQHEACRDLYVAVGNPYRNSGDQRGQKYGGVDMARGMVEQQVCVVVKAANYAGSSRHVSKQQTPCDGRAQPWRQGHRSVGVQRTGRCGMPRIAANAQGNEQHSCSCQRICQPCPIAGECAN